MREFRVLNLEFRVYTLQSRAWGEGIKLGVKSKGIEACWGQLSVQQFTFCCSDAALSVHEHRPAVGEY